MASLVHLVYIHGFQGDDTSFQSFPLHLQERLSSKIPQDLVDKVRFQSSLYPTYKSIKPISHATKNFLAWLKTQPEGPVILVGHSMGGLLAADAVTDPSNVGPDGKPKRMVGFIAFDVPFIGMHPHVVVSGIASLLPKDKKSKTEKEMNQHPQIHIVERSEVTDEWEEFKNKIHRKSRPRSQVMDNNSLDVPRSPMPSSSYSEPSSPGSQSSSLSSLRNRSPSPSFYDKAVDFLAAHSKEEDALVRWLRKHANDPLSAGKRWIVERFQFGVCMFDPSDLGDRYDRLVDWNGLWVNYWTYTGATKEDRDAIAASTSEIHQTAADKLDNDLAIVEAGILDETGERKGKQKHNVLRKSRETDLAASKSKPSMRHFVVLPTGLGRVLGGSEHWEKVPIIGVEDEVAAHTGLFIPDHNLDYANFVDRIADKVFEWCRQLYS